MKKMDLVSGYKGVVGLVFGNENSASSEDSYVERLLDRISNGVLAEDRRSAMTELQAVVAESRAGQLAFGAMGFPVILGVLKEERDDVEMVRGALETLVSALTPLDHVKAPKNEVQPALMNTDLLSREAESISLLLSLLSEDDFYIRYYTLQILTALLTNSPNRLQEAILTIPRGITRLMDMLMDRETKWCPAPGCDYAVDFVVGSGNFDVTCRCSYSFCWNCTEEAHRPVDCDTVAKWVLKNSAESENMNWILANSKPCPKCKRPIEKNQGCMHMICSPPCKFEFCWLCLGAWTDHGERTGGFYACNRYETAKQEGVQYDESEKRREMAKNSLEKYTHYYERWATNQSSRQKALADLQQMQTVHLEKLSDLQCQPESQLKFVTEAWLQIVECRRVLKWTYAYGYYLPEHEHAKRQFFEYLQGEAESGLERLHQCAEKELQDYLNAEGPVKEFNEFRTKLAGLTSVTRNYFENLVRALENGLSDVDTRVPCNRSGSSKSLGGGSSRGRRSKGSTSRSSGSSKTVDDSGHWSCDQCTYANASSATTCAMCQHPR